MAFQDKGWSSLHNSRQTQTAQALMRVLAIDTTGLACSVALADFSQGGAQESVLGHIVEPMQRGHAEALMPMIDRLFSGAAAAPASLDRVAVVVGPGSFTGLRVGVAAARGLALALSIPAVAVTVFEAIREAAASDGPLMIALDAKRDEIYAQAFDAAGEPVFPPCAVAVAEAAGFVPTGARIVGSAAMLLGVDVAPQVLPLDPRAVARVGARRDPADAPPRPLYLRKPDAKLQHHVAIARAR